MNYTLSYYSFGNHYKLLCTRSCMWVCVCLLFYICLVRRTVPRRVIVNDFVIRENSKSRVIKRCKFDRTLPNSSFVRQFGFWSVIRGDCQRVLWLQAVRNNRYTYNIRQSGTTAKIFGKRKITVLSKHLIYYIIITDDRNNIINRYRIYAWLHDTKQRSARVDVRNHTINKTFFVAQSFKIEYNIKRYMSIF